MQCLASWMCLPKPTSVYRAARHSAQVAVHVATRALEKSLIGTAHDRMNLPSMYVNTFVQSYPKAFHIPRVETVPGRGRGGGGRGRYARVQPPGRPPINGRRLPPQV